MAYDIGRATGRCFATNRELAAGEEFIAALCDTPGGWLRKDFGLDQWQGTCDGAVGFWLAKMPDIVGTIAKPKPISTEAILEWFDRLIESADVENRDTESLAYVTALLLVRRKALKLHDVERTDSGEFLVLKRPRGGNVFKVRDPGISEERIIELERELTRMLEGSGTLTSVGSNLETPA